MHILMHRLVLNLNHITDYIVNYHITPCSVSFTKLIHIKVYICGAIILIFYNRCAQIACLPVEQTIHNILTCGARKSSVIKYIQPHPHVLHSGTAHSLTKYTHM